MSVWDSVLGESKDIEEDTGEFKGVSSDMWDDMDEISSVRLSFC